MGQPEECELALAPRMAPRHSDLGDSLVFTAVDVRATTAAVAGGAAALDRSARGFPSWQRLSITAPGNAPFEIWSWT